ncbi:pantoate--beta-alanine ligase [Alteromonas sp. ASW11-130]|uniref:pantoate--beta-alanine ligase n=1 Tax=Alteromonas sp. ASW11-130 TaxID=3015775 RepID=UPI00224219DB|nr:pantoate--beta-alanine ligase [Alteromonas sp. ASW11-130]MCW8091953.1 pantoate--beta-alanine ligase [Alteromonas sp. ASW11-130]
MQIITTVSELRQWREAQRKQNNEVGFVPTMGNLHEGHLQLVKAASTACDVVITSIFVNPMQFGQNEDLDAYPRTIEQDKAKLLSLGVDALFLPSVDEMYPRGLSEQTFVEVPDISHILCGLSRPGHFRGVATVVAKLFNMVQPNSAFFGEKDFQQLLVIKTMVKDLSMDVAIQPVAIEREADGLAMSSRNGYLSQQERSKASILYQTLLDIKKAIQAGDRDFLALETRARSALNREGFETDYVSIRNALTFSQAEKDAPQLVVLVAAFLGTTRLIDNIQFTC